MTVDSNNSGFSTPLMYLPFAAASTILLPRLAAVTLGYAAKGISEAVDFLGEHTISQSLNITADKLITYAKKNPSDVEKITVGSSLFFGMTTNVIARNIPETARFNTVTDFQGLTQPASVWETTSKIASILSENPIGIVFIPLLCGGFGAIASRSIAGTVGLGVKLTGQATQLIGQNDLSQKINEKADDLIAFAVRDLIEEVPYLGNVFVASVMFLGPPALVKEYEKY